MNRRLAYQICYATTALWVLPQAVHAAGIATVVDVVNEGYRTPPGASEITAKSADELVQNEALRTEKESMIQVKFVDGSELSVEQQSEVVLSDYLFDPQSAAATGVINLNTGLFHFNSNSVSDSGLVLKTPVATIGIRGTQFLVHVDGDDATIIDVLDGKVEVTPLGGGKAATCEGGQSILVADKRSDALCGDIGSFATAAALPPQQRAGTQGNVEGRDRNLERQARSAPSSSPPSGGDDPPAGDPGGPTGGKDGRNDRVDRGEGGNSGGTHSGGTGNRGGSSSSKP